MPSHVNDLTNIIIGSAIEVHRNLGPGLLESAYHVCLARELELNHIPFKFKWPLPLEYKGIKLRKGYEMDLVVANAVVVEVKAIAALAPIHGAQLLTYLRLSGLQVGLLMNFNEVVLKNGIRRKVLNLEE
jgi:GxxExxY protein